MADGEFMDMEMVLAGLAEAARIAGGHVPAEATLADAPLINDWIVAVGAGHGVHLVGRRATGEQGAILVVKLDENQAGQ